MEISKIIRDRRTAIPVRPATKGWLAAVLAVLIGVGGEPAIGQAQPSNQDLPGAQVLTRGPVHEAFAGMVAFNPEPGIVINKAPPAVIEEMPPEERPEGDNVSWIPGYWGWDDERSDFLWVSGTWRALPPGRAWMAGYWGQTERGYQWTSGYWADASTRETTYLPAPPATVEVGPNIAAPSIDYGWTPGCWVWYQGHYAWGPGYWTQGRADWDWMPSHYVWTPRGYIFVGGYWDYPVAQRGVLFAPVYFQSGMYSRRGYFYSPTIAINLSVFSDHLFLRPQYSHYYFGDYYAASYSQGGFYASFSFQSGHYGYDPIYSHQRWEHRRDQEWEHRVETSYQYRRDNETARPPRTWTAQRNLNPAKTESQQNRMLVAAPIDQLARQKDSSLRFQPVVLAERQKLAQRGQEVQQSREQRRTLEAKPVDPTVRRPGAAFEPATVQLPRSPIVAKPLNQLGRNQAPPKLQPTPTPDLKAPPKSETIGRQPTLDRSHPQLQPRATEPERTPVRERSVAPPPAGQMQPELQPRAKESAVNAEEPARRSAQDTKQATLLESQPRATEAATKARPEAQRRASEVEKKAQSESELRAPDAAAKAVTNPRPEAPELETSVQPQANPRTKELSVPASETSRGNASELAKQAPRGSRPTAWERAEAGGKGATKLLKNDRQNRGKDNPPRTKE